MSAVSIAVHCRGCFERGFAQVPTFALIDGDRVLVQDGRAPWSVRERDFSTPGVRMRASELQRVASEARRERRSVSVDSITVGRVTWRRLDDTEVAKLVCANRRCKHPVEVTASSLRRLARRRGADENTPLHI